MKRKQSIQSEENSDKLLEYTTNIVSSYLSHNKIPAADIAELIDTVRTALVGGKVLHMAPFSRNLSHQELIETSITTDYIVCLEDGKKLKMLKRYLKTNYDMSPEEYRKKWGLPADYPMVAPRYAEVRSQLAKNIGLGKNPKAGRKRKKYRDVNIQTPIVEEVLA